MDDIADWRRKIDDIDVSIATLLQKRAAYAEEIGKLKKSRNLDVYDPERERFVFERLRTVANGPLDGDALVKIFAVIIEECKRNESTI